MNAFFALDAETGQQLWKATNFPTYRMTVASHRIYVNADYALIALDKQTGEKVWGIPFESSSALTNIAYLEGFVYHPRHSRFVVIDDATGQIVYQEKPRDGTYFWHVAASNKMVFAQTSGHLYAYQPWHLRDE